MAGTVRVNLRPHGNPTVPRCTVRDLIAAASAVACLAAWRFLAARGQGQYHHPAHLATGSWPHTQGKPAHGRAARVKNSGSVAESMGRIVGETPLPVEEAESGTVPRGMPAPASGTPSPNPWDLSLSRQNVCSTLKELERRIGLRRD